MEYYCELVEQKRQGNLVSWDSLTKAQVCQLYLSHKQPITDRDLAELFDVSIEKIKHKRNKYGLSKKEIVFLRAISDPDNETGNEQNTESKERLLSDNNVDRFIIGLVHYCFRNGPVEDMHADGKLSESDIVALNQFMTNKLALVVLLAKENRWLELEILLHYSMKFGSDWDKPSADLDELYEILLSKLKSSKLNH